MPHSLFLRVWLLFMCIIIRYDDCSVHVIGKILKYVKITELNFELYLFI